MKISIIIPVYNEIKTIKEILFKINSVELSGIDKEMIIVDGCSTDGTREFLQDFCPKQKIKLILEEKRSGKGKAVRKGISAASNDIIMIQDADLETDPNDYPSLLKPIEEGQTDIVYGSRFKNGRSLSSWGSYIGNMAVSLFLNLFFSSNLTDIATAYKIFRRSTIRNLHFECNGFDFDIEITAKFLRNGLRIREIPISYYPRRAKDGKKLHWSVGLRALYLIIKYRFLN